MQANVMNVQRMD